MKKKRTKCTKKNIEGVFMLDIEIDEEEVRKLMLQKIEEKIKSIH